MWACESAWAFANRGDGAARMSACARGGGGGAGRLVELLWLEVVPAAAAAAVVVAAVDDGAGCTAGAENTAGADCACAGC